MPAQPKDAFLVIGKRLSGPEQLELRSRQLRESALWEPDGDTSNDNTISALWYPSAVDIEGTIQFILESQARAEIRMEKYETRVDAHETRVDAMEKRLDRRMDAITKLLQQGMRLLIQTDTKLKELTRTQKELAQAQKETDRSLKAFINSLRHGRNGR